MNFLPKSPLTSLKVLAVASLLAGSVLGQGRYGGGLSGLGSTGNNYLSSNYDITTAKSYSNSYGNSWLGGSYSFYTGVRRKKDGNYEKVSVEARGQAQLKFLKKTREAAYARAYAETVRSGGASSPVSTYYGKLTLRLAGQTIMDSTVRGTTSLSPWTKTWDLFPVDPRYSFGLGPVSVTLKGNVGVGVKRNLYYAFGAIDPSADIAGSLEAWGYGRASLSAGVVGITATAEFARTMLGASLGVSIKKGLRTLVTLDIQALRLRLKVWVNYYISRYSRTFVDKSIGKYTKTLLRVGM